jgi:uncharacterized membrane protein YhaH (DUF805 family)
MTPIDWAVLPLKKFATFSGRAPRPEYWWVYLAYMVLALVINILTSISLVFGLLGLVYLALVIPFIAVAVRRLHDSNRTGWWLLAPALAYLAGFLVMGPAFLSNPAGAAAGAGLGVAGIIFLIGAGLSIAVFVFTFLPGTRGPNRFGPDPYEGETRTDASNRS